jgi:hypothetical protein
MQRVLAKKTDPATHVCFLDVVMGPSSTPPAQGLGAGGLGAGGLGAGGSAAAAAAAAAASDSPGVAPPARLPLALFWASAAAALQAAVDAGLATSAPAKGGATDPLAAAKDAAKDGATAKEREAGAAVLVRASRGQ